MSSNCANFARQDNHGSGCRTPHKPATGSTNRILHQRQIAEDAVVKFKWFVLGPTGNDVQQCYPKRAAGLLNVRGRDDELNCVGEHGLKPLSLCVQSSVPEV